MSNIPRASLCVTILDDEDYRVLMTGNGGPEAFGVFVAMLVLGRERLQQGKARQMSETESLKFDNSKTHLLAMTHLTAKQLDKCLTTLASVAADSNSQPWMYLDEDKQLVIRSFFKFNTKTGWGGARQGAGRNSSRIQDESKKNQLDSRAESSRIPSGPGTGTGPIGSDAGGRESQDSRDAREPFDPTDAADRDPEPNLLDGCDEAVMTACTAFGAEFADKVSRERDEIGKMIYGRWDFLKGAFHKLKNDLSRRDARRVDNPLGVAISNAKKWAVAGEMPAIRPPRTVPFRPTEPPGDYKPMTKEDDDYTERLYSANKRKSGRAS